MDAVVATESEPIPAAKAWIKANPGAWVQPWDRKGFRIPGGTLRDPVVATKISGATTQLAKKSRGLLPAPEHIIGCATEAAMVGFDTSLRAESRYLIWLVTTPQAKNLITTCFLQLHAVKGGASRPATVSPSRVGTLGIIGAGMMGQGLACGAALAGIEVVLVDLTLAVA